MVAIAAPEAEVASLPNIILLVGDDHGWEETGYNGHPHVKTPVLDEMAARGLRLDRFYAAHPSCSPTRGSVLTGRHPTRYGTFAPGRSIRPQEITIAQIVGKVGYATGHFGKWHLGPVKAESPTNPGAMGFDEWFSHDNFSNCIPPSHETVALPSAMRVKARRIIVDETKRFIGEAAKQKKAFLAVVWFGSPHEPYQWSQRRSRSHMIISLTNTQERRSRSLPMRRAPACNDRWVTCSVNAMRRSPRWIVPSATCGSFSMPKVCRENTLLWYCGDNGTPPSGVAESPLRGMKGQLFEGGIRVPGVIEWPARVAKPHASTVNAVTSDMLPTICELTGHHSQVAPWMASVSSM